MTGSSLFDLFDDVQGDDQLVSEVTPFDSDNDGIIDTYGYDSNGDGIPDTFGYDSNNDGIPDTFGYDNNNDGIPDTFGYDSNNDGVPDTFGYDSDNDGVPDTFGMDTDNDQIIDSVIDGTEVQDLNDDLPDHVLSTSEHRGSDIDNNGTVSFMEFDTDSSHIGREAYYDHEQGILFPPTFDADSGNDYVSGEPASDMEHWHMQTHPDTCAVVSQEYVLEELLGDDFDENDLRELATENGWYTPGGGTPMNNVGDILEYYGLDVDRGSGSMDDLESALANGDKIIVGIDSSEIWSNGDDAMADHFLEDMMGIPDADADHAVEVIGIDRSDPDNPMVILNDPGHPGGQGAMIPMDLFEDAWADSDNYMVTANSLS